MVLMLRLNKSRHSDLVTMLRAALLDLNDQKYIYIKWLLDCTSWLLHAVVCKVHGDIFSGILISLRSLILDAKRYVYNLDHS